MKRAALALLALGGVCGVQAQSAGQAVYDRSCAACHQPGGKGMAGLAPALAGTLGPLLAADDGRRYLAQVLVHGLSGRIVTQGLGFTGVMPGQAALGDAELAAVANYLARELNDGTAAPYAAEEFARLRGEKVSHKDLRAVRERYVK
ncbi:c-type cytochrome [Pseudorhodoferax sp.]|uniref:c-type cytochrome n=1 Tax=Pseudorhodoferax sp. TaxID=1993553 RepID=UPI002DD6BA20|nr:cytochrome c [Pseudorhodoferax sp.]